jgi:hypothetical protein
MKRFSILLLILCTCLTAATAWAGSHIVSCRPRMEQTTPRTFRQLWTHVWHAGKTSVSAGATAHLTDSNQISRPASRSAMSPANGNLKRTP